jgi:hypothetical protein
VSQGTIDTTAPPRAPALSVPARRQLGLALRVALGAAALVVAGSYLVLAISHLKDRYQINFVSGVYTALALHLNEGSFYPELYDGEHYAGTRYMPLPFVLHAGLARLTGEYLLSGKLLTFGLALVLNAQLFVILRRLGCRPVVAFALPGMVLVSNAGFLACTTIRGDLLPVVLQLGALLVASGERSLRRAAAAGALCALAVLSKMTGAWAIPAVACWYGVRDRRSAAVFLGTAAGLLGLSLTGLHYLTHGRMLENFRALSAAGVQGIVPVLLSPLLLLWRLSGGGVLLGFLVPVLVVECTRAVKQRDATVYHLALFFCLPGLLLIYADMGADYNHLLDLVVLAVPLVGCLWRSLPSAEEGLGGLRAVLAVAMIWVLYASWANRMVFPLRDVFDALRGQETAAGEPACPLADRVAAGERILSEDPWVPIARGQVPVLLDPFVIARMQQSRPEMTADLVRRIETGAFDKIVLLQALDARNPHDRYAWEERHFGKPVVAAMRAHYRLLAKAEGYYIYVPDRERALDGGATNAAEF